MQSGERFDQGKPSGEVQHDPAVLHALGNLGRGRGSILGMASNRSKRGRSMKWKDRRKRRKERSSGSHSRPFLNSTRGRIIDNKNHLIGTLGIKKESINSIKSEYEI